MAKKADVVRIHGSDSEVYELLLATGRNGVAYGVPSGNDRC